HGAAEAKHRRSRPAAAVRLRANARAGARRWLFVKDHMSASADPHLAIIDADVGYFRRHPRRRHRVRPRSQADVEALAQGARTHKSRLLGNRWLPQTTCVLDVQLLFGRRHFGLWAASLNLIVSRSMSVTSCRNREFSSCSSAIRPPPPGVRSGWPAPWIA